MMSGSSRRKQGWRWRKEVSKTNEALAPSASSKRLRKSAKAVTKAAKRSNQHLVERLCCGCACTQAVTADDRAARTASDVVKEKMVNDRLQELIADRHQEKAKGVLVVDMGPNSVTMRWAGAPVDSIGKPNDGPNDGVNDAPNDAVEQASDIKAPGGTATALEPKLSRKLSRKESLKLQQAVKMEEAQHQVEVREKQLWEEYHARKDFGQAVVKGLETALAEKKALPAGMAVIAEDDGETEANDSLIHTVGVVRDQEASQEHVSAPHIQAHPSGTTMSKQADMLQQPPKQIALEQQQSVPTPQFQDKDEAEDDKRSSHLVGLVREPEGSQRHVSASHSQAHSTGSKVPEEADMLQQPQQPAREERRRMPAPRARRIWSEAEHEAVRRKWDWQQAPQVLQQSQQPAEGHNSSPSAVQKHDGGLLRMSEEMEAGLEHDKKLPIPRCCELDQQQPIADIDKEEKANSVINIPKGDSLDLSPPTTAASTSHMGGLLEQPNLSSADMLCMAEPPDTSLTGHGTRTQIPAPVSHNFLALVPSQEAQLQHAVLEHEMVHMPSTAVAQLAQGLAESAALQQLPDNAQVSLTADCSTPAHEMSAAGTAASVAQLPTAAVQPLGSLPAPDPPLPGLQTAQQHPSDSVAAADLELGWPTVQLLTPEDSLEGAADAVQPSVDAADALQQTVGEADAVQPAVVAPDALKPPGDADCDVAMLQQHRQASVTRSHAARGLSGQGLLSSSPLGSKSPSFTAKHAAGVGSGYRKAQEGGSSFLACLRLPSLTKVVKSQGSGCMAMAGQQQIVASSGEVSLSLTSRGASGLRQLLTRRSESNNGMAVATQLHGENKVEVQKGNKMQSLTKMEQDKLSAEAGNTVEVAAKSHVWADIDLEGKAEHIPAVKHANTQEISLSASRLEDVIDQGGHKGLQDEQELATHVDTWAAISSAVSQDLVTQGGNLMSQVATTVSPRVADARKGFSVAANYLRRLTASKEG